MADLRCAACGGKAVLEGRWAKARIRCTECGWERPVSECWESIEDYKQALCEEYERLAACELTERPEAEGKDRQGQ